jgi:hypothetical protein
MTTQLHRSRLAPRQTQQPPRRRHQVDERLQYRRRLIALCDLFSDAPRKPDAIYALQRKEPRCQLPDEKLRSLIHEGIRDGKISRERLIRFRALQLIDDFQQFSDEATAEDVLYVRAMLEHAEAIEAQTIAHTMPNDSNRAAALRETRECIAMQELLCAVVLNEGSAH